MYQGSRIEPVEELVTPDDLQLLAKLEAANRLLESDERSTKSLTSRGSIGEPSLLENGGGDEQTKNTDTISLRSGSSVTSQLSNLQHDGDSGTAPTDEFISEWGNLIRDWDNQYKRRPSYVKELVRKGVPHHFRNIVWQFLCGAHHSPVKDQYADYLRQPSACEKVIYRDIARTYPEHEFFRDKHGAGQESLFHVMKAYSVYDREVGYCQGIGFIVGLLLMQMPEEESFAVLVQMMREYRMRELFKPSMAELGLCMYKLEYLIQEHMPMLYQHFQAQSFHTSMYASPWFLTLFTTLMSIPMCFRVMDLFLCEGMEIILRIGVALLLESEPDLLCLDMEGMLVYFNEKVPGKYQADFDGLLQLAYQLKYNSKQMKKLEKEFNTIKARENEDQVELRRLRSENKLLRQRIENLEKENVTLADRLIHGQVSRAQDAEEMFTIKRELYQAREANYDLAQQLQELSKQSQKPSIGNVRQDELVAAKLHEAEATHTIQELTHRLNNIEREWKLNQHEKTGRDRMTKPQLQTVMDELMSLKLKEAQVFSECQCLKERLIDAEVKGDISSQQLRRAKEELSSLRDQLRIADTRTADLVTNLAEARQHLDNLSSQQKEDAVLGKIHDAEYSQIIAQLQQTIAELEIRKEELLAAGSLADGIATGQVKAFSGGDVPDVGNQIIQARLHRKALGFSTLDIYKGCFGESDSDCDELEDLKSKTLEAIERRRCNLGLKAFSTTDVRVSSSRHLMAVSSISTSSGDALEF